MEVLQRASGHLVLPNAATRAAAKQPVTMVGSGYVSLIDELLSLRHQQPFYCYSFSWQRRAVQPILAQSQKSAVLHLQRDRRPRAGSDATGACRAEGRPPLAGRGQAVADV